MLEKFRYACSIRNDSQFKIAMKRPEASLISSLEADFLVLVDHEIYFYDPYFNALEFIVLLKKPMENLENINSFDFLSVDHDEPIFTYKKNDNNVWELTSIWSIEPNKAVHVSEYDLITAYNDLVDYVNEWLVNYYRISLTKLINKIKLAL